MMDRWPLNYDNTGVTVELRQIVESGVKVWDFNYPSFYTGEAKTAFEQKVLDHYWFRQIGQETVGRFLHMFRSRVRDIMPYYIQLYKSEELMANIDDPFATVDVVETYEEERTGQSSVTNENTSTSTSTGTNTGTASSESESHTERTHLNTHKFSNTPQGTIDNIEMYLTEGSIDDGEESEDNTTSGTTESEATSTGTASGTETGTASGTESGTVRHTLTRKGAQGVTTFGHDMIEFRQSFLNIDLMVINELKDLFLQVY